MRRRELIEGRSLLPVEHAEKQVAQIQPLQFREPAHACQVRCEPLLDRSAKARLGDIRPSGSSSREEGEPLAKSACTG
jgi:hypothetical protein